MIVFLIAVFFIIVFLGIPIAFSMGIAATLTILTQPGAKVPVMVVAQRIFTAMDSFSLMAIPLFVLAGELMNGGGITKGIVHFCGTLIGHIKGGLAHVNILASMLFAGISGSAVADASSIGAMLIPAMVEDGYEPDFSVAVTAASSCLGPIIPPSISMIVYSSMSSVSVGALFIGGLIPGILLGLAQMGVVAFYAKKYNFKKEKRSTLKQIGRAFLGTACALFMPVIIIGGILSGIFTATEAGVVAVIYGMIVGFVTKQLNLRNLKKILLEAAIISATTLIIIGFAQVMSWLLTRALFAQKAVVLITSLGLSNTITLILLLTLLLVLGCFIDTTALLILTIPVLAPLVATLGIHPIQFGVLAVIICVMGACTPPVGVLLFITCGIARIPVMTGAKALLPFLLVMFLVVLVCVFVPDIVVIAPRLLGLTN
jgi:C4-dicarboxylate transporter DctM subunit